MFPSNSSYKKRKPPAELVSLVDESAKFCETPGLWKHLTKVGKRSLSLPPKSIPISFLLKFRNDRFCAGTAREGAPREMEMGRV